jgi:uncharacterized protein (TIGR02452 family)
MSVSRSQAAEIARSTLAILEAGEYRTESGAVVSISDRLRHAITNTESYPPNFDFPANRPGVKPTRITVENTTTLAAVAIVAAEGYAPVALNFASAKNPGGGFLGGARAQEESLARSSGLYPCIYGNPMYDYHRSHHDCMYSHYAIYSPGVPVIRDDEGRLLEQPVYSAFITAPAVNAGVVLQRDSSRRREIRPTMAERTSRVLAIAALKGHDALVLGAWGCGVFRNDPQEVAELFRDALTGPFRGVFSRIIFAITDRSPDQSVLRAFQGAFHELAGSPRWESAADS